MSSKSKIAIIGGGYTGLTAAYELLKKGHDVEIYEASNTVGGLASGFQIHGNNIEKTYHHLFKSDKDIIALANELGIGEKLKWYDSSVSIYYDNKIYPFISPIDLIRFSPMSFIDRIRTGLTILYLQKNSNWRSFTNISAYEWIRKYCGKSSLNTIWEPLLKGKFDRYYDKVSMAWLWARIHIRANSRELGQGEKLGYFDNGFNSFTEALVSKITEMGGKINVSCKVSRVLSEHQASPLTPLQNRGEQQSERSKVLLTINENNYEFDKAIFTVPSDIFAKIAEGQLSLEYKNKLESIEYLRAIVMVFSSDQKIGEYYWHNINDITKPFLVFINHTNLIDKKNYDGKYVYYIGAYIPNDHKLNDLNDEELENLWFGSLEDIFGYFDKGRIIEKHIFRFKNAQHIVDKDYESKIPEYQTPILNVYLSNFSQIFPEDRGTNYAVREGRKIAQSILK